MARGIADLIVGLQQVLPLPVLLGVGVVAAAVGVPLWFESIRAKQIRGLVRRMVRAAPAERQRLTDEVFRLAGTRARRLQVAAESAVKYDQRPLRDAAIDAFERAGGHPADVRRLREVGRKPPVKVMDPVQAAVKIEQLLADGLVVAAREHLEAARRAFPDDEELEALERRVSGDPSAG